MAERATLVFAGSQPKRSITSEYFNGNAIASGSGSTRSKSREINNAIDELDFNFEPTGRQLSRTLPSPEYFQSYEPSANNDPFDFDFLDEMDQENQPPTSIPSDKGKARQTSVPTSHLSTTMQDDPGSDDYGMDDSNDFDPAFLEECAKIERDAISKTSAVHSPSSIPVSTSVSGSSASVSMPSAPKISLPSTNAVSRIANVIEIDDSDDEVLEPDDKENEPVATRHVRRRTNAAVADTGPSQSQNHRYQNVRKKTGQPIILAINPDDIIDLSDSD